MGRGEKEDLRIIDLIGKPTLGVYPERAYVK
jgi:hypothetical protein